MHRLRYLSLTALFCLSCLSALASTVPIFTLLSGSGHKVIGIDAAQATGLNGGVHVAYSTAGLRVSVSSSAPASVKWSCFSMLGAAYAEEIPSSCNDAESWIDSPSGDMGYVIENGSETVYMWLVDYSRHMFVDGELSMGAEQYCDYASLDFTGKADEIAYYSITGRHYVLGRDITLSFNTLAWDENAERYAETSQSTTFASLSGVLTVPSPLCATSFTLSGDRFLREWGEEEVYTSPVYEPHSVSAHTSMAMDSRDNDNEISSPSGADDSMSAPVTVTFKADVTDAAVFHEWQFSKQSDFSDFYLRAQELEIEHVFTEAGTSYVRLYCANDDASCDFYGETYVINIGESSLKCPNAFTPFNRDGVNDEWKVSYTSIVEFECTIFNRNGRKIITLTDPSQGWDGTYSGRNVPTGAYYYVIKAKGSDGRNYNLSGDINILNYK